jgi:hypothetical protein
MSIEINADELLTNAIRDGIREGIKSKLGNGYDSPLDKLVKATIEKHSGQFTSLLEDALASCLGNTEFRNDIATSVRHTLAKVLVQRFGGELEQRVNVLKSDPATRARITVAIDEIVKQKS